MNDQIEMFPDFENEWEKEWHDMPEFLQENQEPVQQIIISFQNYHQVKEFGKLLDQNVTQHIAQWFLLLGFLHRALHLFQFESIQGFVLSVCLAILQQT